jgi:endonuclease YncB( thermonuclease family)
MAQKIKWFIFILMSIMPMTMAQIGHAQSVNDKYRQILTLEMSKARVTQVIDGETMIVNNTDTLHLPAIYIPWETFKEKGEYHAAAKKYLEDNFLNEFVRVYQVRNDELGLNNALGHLSSYVVNEAGVMAQLALVGEGLAFAYPSQSHHILADELYAAEDAARKAEKGLWADEKWAILTAEKANETAERNDFAIVEGTIRKVASRNNVIYLNFDDDWRDDFTIAMNSGLRRDFARNDINVMQLSGQKVRVRGYLRSYNGGFIEIFHPSQMEVVEE